MKIFLLALAVFVLSCNQNRSGKGSPLKDQIMIDPGNGSFLVYNRDSDNDGKPDPYYMIGPGDPEGFFYLGKKKTDNTREDSRQIEILNKMQKSGGNAIYIQIVRSHGGDGDFDHNPWNDPKDPESGLNKTIIAQWRGWLDIMKNAGITVVLFIYDDGSHPFDDGGCENNGLVNEAEDNFIESIVNSFEDFPNLIWVIQEEFKYVSRARSDIERKPCTLERIYKMKNLAALIRKYDDHRHIVGVHHNVGDEMHFANDPNIDMYVQQADTRKEDMQKFHIDGVTGSDNKNRFVYVMGESFDWNHRLMRNMDRTTLRRMYYATALAGGYHLALGMFTDNDPSDEMLTDMRVLQRYFESTGFNRMHPDDDLKNGDTDWVLTGDDSNSFILYSYNDPENLGIKGLPKGFYTLKWMDPITGQLIIEDSIEAKGDALFKKPVIIGEEAILFGKK